jgi:hypothetical protein
MFRKCIPENTLPMKPGVFGAYEIPLLRLQPWYDDLSFKKIIHTPTLLKKQMKYFYKVVFFFPNVNKEEKCTEIPNLNQGHILGKLSGFYKSIFNVNLADVDAIDIAIAKYPSILILAIFTNKTGEASKLAHPPAVDLEDWIEVVGAMTYVLSQMDPHGVLYVPPYAIILWFATSKTPKAKNYKENPIKNLNWSGNGFGFFFLYS